MADKNSILANMYDLYMSGYENHVKTVLINADNEMDETIYNIGVDIYRSCIKDYYAKYTPTVYKRHGNLTGFNLYQASDDFEINDNEIAVGNDELDAMKLLKYPGKNGAQKRRKVLNSVINGLRGNKAVSGFPMEFVTSYPNKYSTLSYWSSSGHTIYDIFEEFENNISKDLDYIYWDYLEENL
nr:MAG TPA: hypothetical protein [Caudoviricetes sp.]